MTSEGEITGHKRLSSAPASDDEISVIAVIKKGTSGIPKRARYHYIRELPLTSVKSLKKSLQKGKENRRSQGRALIPTIEGCSKSTLKNAVRVVNEAKKLRVIELSDETSKMELRKQFKMAEESTEEKERFYNEGSSSLSTIGGSNIIHKLPPGTVLIKQEPSTPRREVQDDNPSLSNNPQGNNPGSNTNGSSAGTTTTTTTTTSTSSSNTSGSSSASSVSSCGSGSSSGGFGSGSASPTEKAKRLHRASNAGSRKKIMEIVPRRNPKRCGSKKGSTMTEVTIPMTASATTMTTRPRQRQRLLTTRRQERNEGTAVTGTNRRTKLTTMPYMNTRSVTRKLYTVGATYQPPTRKDETEWREWPVHGMHERPVFHPQIGLAAGYGGRIFWSTPDAEGLNWTYREVLDAPEEVEIVSVDPRPNQTLSSPSSVKAGPGYSEESFKVCMHDSLHSVLAYCAQVMTPSYRHMVEKKQRHDHDAQPQPPCEFLSQKNTEEKYPEMELLDAESTHLNLSRLEDSSISDETLMEMSSIYKKLLPIEDQPSSREGSLSASAKTSPSSGNNHGVRNTAEGCSVVPKNANETSEIAKILSEYNESLRETSLSRSLSSTIASTAPRSSFVKDTWESEVQQKTLMTGKTLVNEGVGKSVTQNGFSDDIPKVASETEINENHWLQELLVDTSLLYCVANGVGQRDLTEYVDSLDGKQSLQWLRRHDG